MTDHKTYDLFNPTTARRCVHDGIKNKLIAVDPGQTLQDVPLADHVYEHNATTARRVPRNTDLVITPSDQRQAPPPPKPEVDEAKIVSTQADQRAAAFAAKEAAKTRDAERRTRA